MKNKNRSVPILFKTISRNFINVLFCYPKMIYMSNHPEKYTREEQYNYCVKIIRLVMDTSRLKVETYGMENIPAEDGFYVCSNHQEKFDPLAIWYTFPRQVGVILDDKACHRPFIREVCKLINSQKLINDDMHAVLNVYNEITQSLKNKQNYMVFPEGGYELEYKVLGEFHAGCFKSPQRAKCPILPVAIVDSYCIFDKGYKTTKPIQIHYLKPIQPEEYANFKTNEIAELVKSRIKAELDIYQK